MRFRVFTVTCLWGLLSFLCFANPCEDIGFSSQKEFKTAVYHALLGILKPESKPAVNLESCGAFCLQLASRTDIRFQIKIDNGVLAPEVQLSSISFGHAKSKILKIPSAGALTKTTAMEDTLRYWLVGHELHPYFSEGKIMIKPVQEVAFKAYTSAILEGAKSFLHISPTAVGKTLVLVRALIDSITRASAHKNIAIVTVNRVHIVNQLAQTIQQEINKVDDRKSHQLKGHNIKIVNWNYENSIGFEQAIKTASERKGFTVFVITSQGLKHILNGQPDWFKKRLATHLNSIFLDEAHHLGAYLTKETLLNLQETSGAFLYGATATPVHHEVALRDLFQKVHWSYLNTEENFFQEHPSEGILRQLSKGIQRGDLTPFDDLYFIAEALLNKADKTSRFMDPEEHKKNIENKNIFITENQRQVLNPEYYSKLVEILYPILSAHKKGFLVTATVREAEKLTGFLSATFPHWNFESYHWGKSSQEKHEILSRSRWARQSHYIVAVRALDEGVDLPHLSVYIDLNANVAIKQMLQRIGRVLRLQSGKVTSDIVLLIDYRNEQTAKELLNILDVIKVVNFSHTKIDTIKKTADTQEVDPLIYSLEPPTFNRADLAQFRVILEDIVKQFWIRSRVTNDNRPPMEEFTQVVIEQEGIKTAKEYHKRRKTEPILKRFPSRPMDVYPGFRWPGRHIRFSRNYGPSRQEFEDVVINQMGIRTHYRYLKKRATDPSVRRFPDNPIRSYPGFKWPQGNRIIVTKDNMPSLEEFKQVVLGEEGIQTATEYHERRKTNLVLKLFPSTPIRSYPGFRWPGNRIIVTKDNMPSLEEFREVVIEQEGILNVREYLKRRQQDPSLTLFPSNPTRSYKGFKWPGTRISISDMPPLEEFRQVVIEQEGILNQKEYQARRKTDPSLKRFPSVPWKTYPGFKWPGVRSRLKAD